MSPEAKGCHLGLFGKCCCKCRFHLTDYRHCATEKPSKARRKRSGKPKGMGIEGRKCVCNVPKGFICMPHGFRAHSGWPEHGLCEMYQPPPPQ